MKTQTPAINSTSKSLVTPSLSDLIKKFNAWTKRMEYYRIVVLSVMIISQSCVFAPIALWSMHLTTGFHSTQAFIVICGLFSVLVTNLAVQPMRVTIPVYVLSSFAQLGVIGINLSAMI
ncbi:MAG: hypothetical protein AAGA66_00060 [Bacteroidota bacterium]